MQICDTFPKLMARHARERGGKVAMRHKDRGVWRSWTWAQAYREMLSLAHALDALGVRAGDRVAVAGANRPRLYWAMTAAQALGAIATPLYADAVAEEMARVLVHCGASVLVAQDQEQVDKVIGQAVNLPALRHVLYDEPRGLRDYDHARLHALDVAMTTSALALADPAETARLEALIAAGRGEAPCTMLYTSGTTGQSKGVVLSGARCIAAASDTVAFDRITDADSQLAYLPLAWVGDHYLNYAQGYVAGACMACPESPETAQEDLREIGPTFYFAPPRTLEAMLTRIMIRIEDAGGLKRWMVRRWLGVAKRWGEVILDGGRAPLWARADYAIGEALVYGPLKNVLGFSRLRVAYTAGEAIGADLFAFYRALGINVKQLYGQTEAFLYVACQPDGAIRADAVGPAAPNVRLRIAADGEVQFQSPGQFLYYYNEPEKTADALTPDGFVKTGDAGLIEADGQLKIIDRAKDVGRLSDGCLFAPKYIENKLKFFPDIKEAVAFGDGRGHVAVMLNIELASVGNWAERRGIGYASYQELANHAEVYSMMAQRVDAVNLSLSHEPMLAGAQIARFLILPKELDADDGELTRTQKVRRSFIAERYAPLVAALYDGGADAMIEAPITYDDGRTGVLRARVRIEDARRYGLAGPVAATPIAERAA